VRFQRVGVVGAGVIGAGVAQLFAQTGHDVVLVDVRDEALEGARRGIARNLKLATLLQGERLDPAAVLARLQTARDVHALVGAHFVIENVTKDWEVERRVHEEIHAVVSADAPIAANTSAIPITRIGSVGCAAHRVVGMHFMNPPPLMPMVEIIRGAHTSDDTVAAAQALAAQAGRQSIVVNDSRAPSSRSRATIAGGAPDGTNTSSARSAARATTAAPRATLPQLAMARRCPAKEGSMRSATRSQIMRPIR